MCVGDFVWCLHRRGITCVIMGTIPTSPIEYEFKRIMNKENSYVMDDKHLYRFLFWLPRIGLLLYAIFPLVENMEAIGDSMTYIVLVIFILFLIGCVLSLIVSPKRTLLFLLGSSKKENIIDICLSAIGLCISIYAKGELFDGVWVILLIGSLLNLIVSEKKCKTV